jgi:hypothetical protein
MTCAKVALAAVPPVTYLAFLALNGPGRWLRFIDDDAYYYLGVARHLAAGDGSTFGGLVPTNGYQPLWLAVLVPVAAVVRGRDALVVAVVVIQSAIWVGVVREGLRIGRRYGSDVSAIGAVAVLGVLAFGVRHLAFNGMESALLLLLLLVAVRLIVEADSASRLDADVRLGCVLALICLSRLDAVVTAAALAAVAVACTRDSPTPLLRRVLALGGPSALALGAYAAFNTAIFGVALPVSGEAKTVGGPFFSVRAINDALEVRLLGRPTWLGALTLVVVVAAAAVAWTRATPHHRRLLGVMAAILAGQVAFIGYLSVFTSYGVLSWYLYHTGLLLFLACLVLFDAALRRRPAVVGPAIVAVVAFVLVGQVAGAFIVRDQVQDGGFAAAEFVDTQLPDGAVLAMGDRAGQFGYYSDRRLLQLEGLTADAAYIDQLADGDARQRMVSEGVDYYARYGGGHRVTVVSWGCWGFGEPAMRNEPLFSVVACEDDLVYRVRDADGQEFTIWRFRPKMQDIAG